MTDMTKKDNDISRVASGLMTVAVVALVIIGWVAAVVTSDDTGIAKLEPWWRGLSAIFLIPLFSRRIAEDGFSVLTFLTEVI